MNVLNISEYKELVKMIRSSKEDKNLAIENLKNLKIDNIYKIFVLKGAHLDDREYLLKELVFLFEKDPFSNLYETIERQWGRKEINLDLSWSALHDVIKKHYNADEDVKKLFELIFKSETESTIIKALNFDFVDNVETTIKW